MWQTWRNEYCKLPIPSLIQFTWKAFKRILYSKYSLICSNCNFCLLVFLCVCLFLRMKRDRVYRSLCYPCFVAVCTSKTEFFICSDCAAAIYQVMLKIFVFNGNITQLSDAAPTIAAVTLEYKGWNISSSPTLFCQHDFLCCAHF